MASAFGMITAVSGRAITLENSDSYNITSIRAVCVKAYDNSTSRRLQSTGFFDLKRISPEEKTAFTAKHLTQLTKPIKSLDTAENPVSLKVELSEILDDITIDPHLTVHPIENVKRLIEEGKVNEALEIIDTSDISASIITEIILEEINNLSLQRFNDDKGGNKLYSLLLKKSPTNEDFIKIAEGLIQKYTAESVIGIVELLLLDITTIADLIIKRLDSPVFNTNELPLLIQFFLDKNPSMEDVNLVTIAFISKLEVVNAISLMIKHAQKTNPDTPLQDIEEDIGAQFLKICQDLDFPLPSLCLIINALIQSHKLFLAEILLKNFVGLHSIFYSFQPLLDNQFPEAEQQRHTDLRELASNLPQSVNLRSKMSPVKFQGGVGSCTAFAVTSSLEYLFPDKMFSEAALFTAARLRSFGGGGSAYTSTYLQLLSTTTVSNTDFISYERYQEYVIHREALWEMEPDLEKAIVTYADRISDIIAFIGEFHPEEHIPEKMLALVSSDGQPNTALPTPVSSFFFPCKANDEEALTLIKIVLNHSVPLMVLLNTYKDSNNINLWCENKFYDPTRSLQTILPVATGMDATSNGPHAVSFCGYDETHDNGDGTVGAFLLKNSWGQHWADEGFCWISYQYVKENIENVLAIVKNPNAEATPDVLLTTKQKQDQLLRLLSPDRIAESL